MAEIAVADLPPLRPLDEDWERALSLAAHRAYIEGLGWEHFDPAEFLGGISRATGVRLGAEHAAAFEVFSMTFGE